MQNSTSVFYLTQLAEYSSRDCALDASRMLHVWVEAAPCSCISEKSWGGGMMASDMSMRKSKMQKRCQK